MRMRVWVCVVCVCVIHAATQMTKFAALFSI